MFDYRRNEKALKQLLEKARIESPEIADQLHCAMVSKYDYRTDMEAILDALLNDLHGPISSFSVFYEVVKLNKTYLDLKDFLLKALALDERRNEIHAMYPTNAKVSNLEEKLEVILGMYPDLKYTNVEGLDIFHYCATSRLNNGIWKKYIEHSPNKKYLWYQALHNFCHSRSDVAEYLFANHTFTVEDFFVLAKKIKEKGTPLRQTSYSEKDANEMLDAAFSQGFSKATLVNPHQLNVLLSESYAKRFPKTHTVIETFKLEKQLRSEVNAPAPVTTRRNPSPGRF